MKEKDLEGNRRRALKFREVHNVWNMCTSFKSDEFSREEYEEAKKKINDKGITVRQYLIDCFKNLK